MEAMAILWAVIVTQRMSSMEREYLKWLINYNVDVNYTIPSAEFINYEWAHETLQNKK